jgi:hypothetical protein
VFENRVLRSILEPRIKEITGEEENFILRSFMILIP